MYTNEVRVHWLRLVRLAPYILGTPLTHAPYILCAPYTHEVESFSRMNPICVILCVTGFHSTVTFLVCGMLTDQFACVLMPTKRGKGSVPAREPVINVFF